MNILISSQADVFSLTGCHFPPLLSLELVLGYSFSVTKADVILTKARVLQILLLISVVIFNLDSFHLITFICASFGFL